MVRSSINIFKNLNHTNQIAQVHIRCSSGPNWAFKLVFHTLCSLHTQFHVLHKLIAFSLFSTYEQLLYIAILILFPPSLGKQRLDYAGLLNSHLDKLRIQYHSIDPNEGFT